MGYILGLWAAPVDGLLHRMAVPGVDAVADHPAGIEGTAAQMEAVEAWLTEAGRPMDAVDHSSSAGEWFREEVIGGAVAGRVGSDLADHLLSRPVAGLVWSGYPSVGWVRNAELRAALTDAARADVPDPDSDEGQVVQTITDTLVRVLDSGEDLVTHYG